MPHGGVEVIDTTHELHDIYQIRTALEGCAARLAASRIGAAALSELQDLADQSAALEFAAVERRIAVNTAFHDGLCRASGSPRLIEMIDEFREFFLTARGLRRFDRDDTKAAVSEHQAIVDALRAGDGERVETVLRHHLLSAYQTIHETDPGASG
jgi:DNA-binding GntR family transcriptional regulator